MGEAGDPWARSQVPRGRGALVSFGRFSLRCRMGRHHSKPAKPMPWAPGPSPGLSPGNADGQCPRGGRNRGVTRRNSRGDASFSRDATCPDAARNSLLRPRGQGLGASAHPSLSGPQASLAAAASAAQAGTEGVGAGAGRAAPGQTEVPCQTHTGLLLGHAAGPASSLQAPVGRRPCSDRRPEPGPASAQSWRRGLYERLQLAARLRVPTKRQSSGGPGVGPVPL